MIRLFILFKQAFRAARQQLKTEKIFTELFPKTGFFFIHHTELYEMVCYEDSQGNQRRIRTFTEKIPAKNFCDTMNKVNKCRKP